MKVLSILNVSNPDNIACDSGFIFQTILSRELFKRGIEIVLIGPDTPAFRAVKFPDGYEKICVPLGTSKYQVRYWMEWPYFADIIKDIKPRLILNNQIELSAAIRAILVTLRQPPTILVSYCHYLPIAGFDPSTGKPLADSSLNEDGLCQPILLNILASCLASDAVLVQSQFAKQILLRAARYHRVPLENKIHILNPPLDHQLILKTLPTPTVSKNILYNHRIYEHYGMSETIKLMDTVSKRLEIQLIIPNILLQRSEIRDLLDPSVRKYYNVLQSLNYVQFVDGGDSRKVYKSIVANSRLGIAAFRNSCVWSMATTDLMGMGIPVIAPRFAAYPEFVPDELLFNDYRQAEQLCLRLMTDDDYWKVASKLCYHSVSHLHPSRIADAFMDILNRETTYFKPKFTN